ncbi:MAG: hypothetical protein GXO89_01240 [Chlorobi bacterium]|nr:hypothetical protein [Chlorobiota bacterium]
MENENKDNYGIHRNVCFFWAYTGTKCPQSFERGATGGRSHDTSILVVLFVLLLMLTAFTVYKYRRRDRHI